MPNFSCANLADANFDHHTLFPGVLQPLERIYTKGDQAKSGWYQSVPLDVKEVAQAAGNVAFPI
jgi:hypothetical protein